MSYDALYNIFDSETKKRIEDDAIASYIEIMKKSSEPPSFEYFASNNYINTFMHLRPQDLYNIFIHTETKILKNYIPFLIACSQRKLQIMHQDSILSLIINMGYATNVSEKRHEYLDVAFEIAQNGGAQPNVRFGPTSFSELRQLIYCATCRMTTLRMSKKEIDEINNKILYIIYTILWQGQCSMSTLEAATKQIIQIKDYKHLHGELLYEIARERAWLRRCYAFSFLFL